MREIVALWRSQNPWLGTVLLIAASARLSAWFLVAGVEPVGDEVSYLMAAYRLANSRTIDDFWPPVTGVLTSTAFLIGGSEVAARFLWVVMGTVNVYLLYVLLSRYLDAPVPALASAVYSVYIPAISFSVFVTSETPAALFFLIAAILVLDPHKKVPMWRCLLAGLAGALLILSRPSLAFLSLVVALFAAPVPISGTGKHGRTTACLAVLFSCSLVVAPWIVRNYAVHGSFLVAGNTGYNFYLGNNPEYQEDLNLFNPVPTRAQVAHRRTLLLGQQGSPLKIPPDLKEQMSQAFQYIREEPVLFARRALGRLARILVPKTSPLVMLGGEKNSPVFHAKAAVLLLATNGLYGAMLFLGWAGIILCGNSPGETHFRKLALSVIAASSVLCMVAISKPRYSFPFDPFLAAGLCWLVWNRHRLKMYLDKKSLWVIAAGWLFFAWTWIAWLVFAFLSRAAVYTNALPTG
ncbi:MAG: glycosyltransferase family 39 protein [Deltaproteobacteria bacterium]|nr:glycosyltransferase family 39 protein [Deltaproteobacteria bacterium]